MERGTLPKRTLLLWQIRVVMLTALLIWLCLYLGGFMLFFNWIALALALICLIIVGWYLPIFFKGYEILVKGEAIIINYGVFIKFSHIMPYSRLIYAQSFATPLARLFGVTMLSLKAARSRVIVPEIDLKEAMGVMNSLASEVLNEKDL